MALLTPQYLPAMNALNEFYEMLFRAMELALPKAKLSMSGAYVWRGYKIDKYKNLATSQYFCEIYPDKPHLLKFQESYHIGNKYYYPFVCTFDLQLNNFFSKSMDGQLDLLESFLCKASENALKWQDSEERKQKVHASFLHGSPLLFNPRKRARRFTQVPDVLLHAFPMQTKIFDLLLPPLRESFENCFSLTIDLRPNDSWYNWGFRGYRIKINNPDGTTPEGPSDYVCRIYYNSPGVLTFEKYGEDECQTLNYFWLQPGFLSAPENQQVEYLREFTTQVVEALP